MAGHDGHRDRLRERYLRGDLDCLADHEVLELLLYYAVPRRNTNDIAHELIERFGSLPAVLDAPISELVKVDYISKNGAILIKLINQINRRYILTSGQNETILSTTEEAGKYIAPLFSGERDEVVYVLCIDGKCKLLSCRILFKGSVSTAGVNTRRVVEEALATNCVGVIMAHNHPSGFALPSDEDIETTKLLKEALGTIGVQLVDHIIVADGDYVSMADSGMV